MGYNDFISKLNPKVASALKTAENNKIERLPLASVGLTDALGGGIAKGRVSLFYGTPSAGKSLLMQQSIGRLWQPAGLVCAYVDVESAYEKDWAAKQGVNNDELILIQSKSSGKIEEEITPLLDAEIDLIVIDSISDILPEVFVGKGGELNSQEDRKQIGSQAKAITALLNGIHYRNKNTAVCLISQTTTFFGQSYVEQVPHGGQKTQFASSQIVRLNSSASPNQQITDDVEIDGHLFKKPVARDVDWLVKKNKLGAPFGSGTYRMFYDGPYLGIDNYRELAEEAVAFGVVAKGGAWFSFGDKKWQGLTSLVKELRDSEEFYDEIRQNLLAARNGGLVV